MQVEVRLFGGLAARAGASRATVDLDEPATVASLRTAVAAQLPELAELVAGVKVAVDLEVADDDTPVGPTRELALLPPVAGGSGPEVRLVDGVRVTTGLHAPPLPVDATIAAVTTPAVGATVTFLGSVRDHAPDLDRVVGLDYSAYPEMAAKVLDDIADELVAGNPGLVGVALLHTVGDLSVGDPTILVVCTAAHRDPAFSACRDGLEQVKDRVPVWKRERTVEGRQRWVGLPAGDDPNG